MIVPYDSGWPRIFLALRARAAAAIGDLTVSIEHIGSTAVPGLAAKPVIDLVVVVFPNDVQDSIERLVASGYAHQAASGSKVETRSTLCLAIRRTTSTCRRLTVKNSVHS